MRNIMLTIEYDGSEYKGWQKQKNASSIQESIENAIYEITKEKVDLTASGRTDTGVHALGQVANFKSNTNIPLEKLIKGINAKLNEDISIVDIKEVNEDFHARFSARRKRYKYIILNSPYRSPIHRKYAYHVVCDLDIEKMREEALKLMGQHDFKSFMSSGSNVKSTIRTIYDISIKKNEDFIELEIEGNSFLYNMVRIIAGTLIDIGRGKLKKNMDDIITQKNRNAAGHTALACGLFLKKVFY